MIDAVKDYLAPKRFGIVAYVCLIVHFLCGLAFTAVTGALRASEGEKFSCSVDAKSTDTYKTQVDQSCFARYDQTYNNPLPLYGFVSLSIGLPVLVSVVYSLIVSSRVDEIESNSDYERETDGEAEHYVFYCYFVHLVLRALFGTLFTVLQHTYFYPNGFDFKFACSLVTDQVTSSLQNVSRNLNSTSVTCENGTASEKWLSGIFVSVINTIVAFFILAEIIYLSGRLPILNRLSEVDWCSDVQLVRAHFLRKRRVVPFEFQLKTIECINIYKQQVSNRSLAPDINYGPKACLDDFYIDVVIHTERARHKFSKHMERHEIYDVYMEVPSTSIRLEKIIDLFYPNDDTKNKCPRSVLAIGRPGIGKTVLTEKIIRDWANGIENYYLDKIPFFFKLRWFNNELEKTSLKKFLQFGTGLSDEKFERIYEEITNEPQKAILIFDGLDEFHGNPIDCLGQSGSIPNDPNTCMSAMNLFIKLVLGDLLKGATVLVTSRPTADDFYSRLDFDRSVEIIGFTSDKIEEYVSRFCGNNNKTDLKPKIWNHIKSSSELLNLCYIPVNCFIVCVTFSGCLSDPTNDTGALPTTLTELYQAAIDYFEKYHHRNADGNDTTRETLKHLQQLAFYGMENGRLIFDQELFDEQKKKSGLLNSFSNPIFPIQTQFCFIHLTIQEFLAARHVTETLAPVEIKTFISKHVRSGKWHLVLQFIAGLLGKKMRMFDGEYKDCVSAFAENFEVTDDGEIILNYNQVFVMKCLREVDDEEIVKDVCRETTALNNVVKLNQLHDISPSDCAAVTSVCKHMKNLAIRFVKMKADHLLEFLHKKCISTLELEELGRKNETEPEFRVHCTLNHKHTTSTSSKLKCCCMTDAGVSKLCTLFEIVQASELVKFDLDGNELSSIGISKLCGALKNGYCVELTDLRLRITAINDEDANVLYKALPSKLCKLTRLHLIICSLTYRSIPALIKALQDERCQLTVLSLWGNEIGDEGVSMLSESLTKQHCKLTKLDLSKCGLTHQCIPKLCQALQDERCHLTVLLLAENDIGDEGVGTLFENALTNDHCKLTELDLRECSLTEHCIPRMCEALQNESCKLTVLLLWNNNIGDKGVVMLFQDALTKEQCKLTELNLDGCELTDRCISTVSEALQDERCRLTQLSLTSNLFTNKSKRLQSCKNRGLKLCL